MGDLYEMLGLQDKLDVTTKEIKKAYKKASLKYHPDKLGAGNVTEDSKAMWLKLQNAHDTLTDSEKRKKYDSSLPFDDSIPVESEYNDETEFYEVVNKYFQRNSRWSKKKNVPLPGDATTEMKEVRAFYNFWNSFESWRVFSQFDEFNVDAIDEAQDRYERRYMENENKKNQKKHLKGERTRIINLVGFMYKNDPRIIAELAEEEAVKDRVKQAWKDKKALEA